MEPGGKGSFQAFKLQRPARTTVCSHSTRDMAASRSTQIKVGS
jgi:predicted RNA binding protein YcfA (HicA-like mRNA interferase family)